MGHIIGIGGWWCVYVEVFARGGGKQAGEECYTPDDSVRHGYAGGKNPGFHQFV